MKKLLTMVLIVASLVGLIGFQPVSAKKKVTYSLDKITYIVTKDQKVQAKLVSSNGKVVNPKKVKWYIDDPDVLYGAEILWSNHVNDLKVSKKGVITQELETLQLVDLETRKIVHVQSDHYCETTGLSLLIAKYKGKIYTAYIAPANYGYTILDNDLAFFYPSWWKQGEVTVSDTSIDYFGPSADGTCDNFHAHVEVIPITSAEKKFLYDDKEFRTLAKNKIDIKLDELELERKSIAVASQDAEVAQYKIYTYGATDKAYFDSIIDKVHSGEMDRTEIEWNVEVECTGITQGYDKNDGKLLFCYMERDNRQTAYTLSDAIYAYGFYTSTCVKVN